MSESEQNTNEATLRSCGLAQTPKDLLGHRTLYDAWGSAAYDDASGPPYYLYDGEKQLLADCSAELVSQLIVGSLVDLGCGSGAKIVPLLRAFVAKNGKFRYVPVDQSREFLAVVAKNVTASVPGVVVDGVEASYRDEAALRQHAGGTLYTMFGSEICCQNSNPETSVFELLRSLRNVMNPEDHVLFAIDPLQNPAVHCASYDGPESHAWFKHIVVGLGAAFECNLDSEDFEYVPRWETGLRQQAPWSAGVVHWLKSKKHFQLTHPDDASQTFDIRENELLFMLQSAKVTPAEFKDLLASCGFSSSCPDFCNDHMCLLTFAKTTENDDTLLLPEE